jgi:signal transduction histidine kinase
MSGFSARMQRFYPWLAALLVLVPALLAWQMQNSQRTRDLARFRQMLRDTGPVITKSASACQDLANQVMNHAAKRDDDWATYEPVIEWRIRHPQCLGYGYARWTDGRLEVVHWSLRTDKPALPEGADLLALDAVRAAWEFSLRTGDGGATQAVPVLAGDKRDYVLVTRPVYGPEGRPATEAERRATVRGLAFSVMDQDAAIEQGLREVDRKLLTVERIAPDSPDERGDFVRTSGLSMGGFTWKLRFSAGPEFFSRSAQTMPLAVLGVGVLLAALIFGLTHVQARRRTEVEALNRSLDARVETLTARLVQENEQLRLAQEEMRGALVREQELSELKSRVVTTISHEFRTPLSVILSSSELLRLYSERLTADERLGHLTAIEDSVRRMSALIQSVLAFSQAGAGKLEFRPERQDVAGLFRQVLDEVLSATSRRCPISMEIQGADEPAWVDVTLLRLILNNLLGNAVKYSAAGSPVELRVSRNADDLVMEVADHGIGIPAKDQPGLFQTFHRGRNTHGIPGTGLGLSIVKTCVELHHGRIAVCSEPNQGTTITVHLRAFVEPPPASPTASAVPFTPRAT